MEFRKKEELDNMKAGLADTRFMLEETLNRINKLETQFKEDKAQYQKKIKNMQNVQATQSSKIVKYNNEIKSLETVTQMRTCEKNSLVTANEQLKEEFEKLKESAKNLVRDYDKTVEELEESIKAGYSQLQTVKDMEVLLELGLSSLTPELQHLFIEEVSKRRDEAGKKRLENMKALDEACQQTEREIKQKREELNLIRQKYSTLMGVYNMSKSVRDRI